MDTSFSNNVLNFMISTQLLHDKIANKKIQNFRAHSLNLIT